MAQISTSRGFRLGDMTLTHHTCSHFEVTVTTRRSLLPAFRSFHFSSYGSGYLTPITTPSIIITEATLHVTY